MEFLTTDKLHTSLTPGHCVLDHLIPLSNVSSVAVSWPRLGLQWKQSHVDHSLGAAIMKKIHGELSSLTSKSGVKEISCWMYVIGKYCYRILIWSLKLSKNEFGEARPTLSHKNIPYKTDQSSLPFDPRSLCRFLQLAENVKSMRPERIPKVSNEYLIH